LAFYTPYKLKNGPYDCLVCLEHDSPASTIRIVLASAPSTPGSYA